MRRDVELESLAERLESRAGSAMMCDRPEQQHDLRAAADIVRDYVAILRITGKGAIADDDLPAELGKLLFPAG
jgi:hypothetical protein